MLFGVFLFFQAEIGTGVGIGIAIGWLTDDSFSRLRPLDNGEMAVVWCSGSWGPLVGP